VGSTLSLGVLRIFFETGLRLDDLSGDGVSREERK
jgi:hypothetical protein